MRKKLFPLIIISLFLGGPVLAADREEHPISRLKLAQESLPPGMSLQEELWATERQIYKIRRKVGFPVNAVVNQTLLYQNERAQVNYIFVRNDDWRSYGYSRLIQDDGDRSFILLKDRVIVQIAATSEQLQDSVGRLFEADPLQYRKVRSDRLPEGWVLTKEKYLSREGLTELGIEEDSLVESSLLQEFYVGRVKVKLRYFRCESPRAAHAVSLSLEADRKPVLFKQVETVDSIVVVAESQDRRLNQEALSLANREPVADRPTALVPPD